MSEAKQNNNSNLTASNVADYLKDHVDFFQQYPDLLLSMKFSDQPNGSISLVERQMKGLRHRNKEFEEELHQVIRNAHDNEQLLQQTIGLSLTLISSDDIESLTTSLFMELKKSFNIEFQNLLLDENIFAGKTSLSVNMDSIRKTLGDNFPKNQPVCGRLKSSEKGMLFKPDVPVESVAILPLGETGELGLLVLGSKDPTHFDPEMGDLFLLMISDMLSRLLNRYSK
ncbi:MAG: DUF484 family protein [Gammaproteobacteria bacterium]|nr:DUF484 family protein [Gammaproteobacteria bacterium]